MRTYLLEPNQRAEIISYLEKRPKVMSQTIKTIRYNCKRIDFEVMRQDLDLMEQIHGIPTIIGRKPKKMEG